MKILRRTIIFILMLVAVVHPTSIFGQQTVSKAPELRVVSVVLKTDNTITINKEVEKVEPTRSASISRGGNPSDLMEAEPKIIKQMDVQATAYCLTGVTASGAYTTMDKTQRTVATDWRVIPPGTRFCIDEIPDTIFIAEDTGSAIKGIIIDLYSSSYDWCMNWGRKNIKINIIEWGNENWRRR